MSFGGSVELQKAHVSSCISSVIVFTLTFSPRSIIRSPQVMPLLSHQFVWLPGAIVQKNNTPNGDCFFVFFVQLLLLSQSMCNRSLHPYRLRNPRDDTSSQQEKYSCCFL